MGFKSRPVRIPTSKSFDIYIIKAFLCLTTSTSFKAWLMIPITRVTPLTQ
jgi:hypothetical protein